MTSNFKEMQSTETSEDDDTEARVRRALGLNSTSPTMGRSHQAAPSSVRQNIDRPKSRFVRDGDVPVVVLNGRRDNELHNSDLKSGLSSLATNRRDEADIVLKAERKAREGVERRLIEALATIQDLQTKLGHAMLSRDEALAGALRANHERDAAALTLDAELTARKQAEPVIAEPMAKAAQPAAKPKMAIARQPKVNPPDRARSKAKEPKPVKWWIKQKPNA